MTDSPRNSSRTVVSRLPADTPTILATSGGIQEGRRTRLAFSALTDYAVELSGTTGRAPRMCLLATAMGDDRATLNYLAEAAQERGCSAGAWLDCSPCGNCTASTTRFTRPGKRAWCSPASRPVRSVGTSGTTDSLGPDLRAVTEGLGFVPFSNGVHYDSEPQRRPLLQRLVGNGTLPAGNATDDGAGVLYHGTEFVEAIAETDGAGAYFVTADGERGVTETRLDTRRL